MDKVLLSGLLALLLGSMLSTILPALGIIVDLGAILDGSVTIADLVELAGFILVAVSEKGRETIKAAAKVVVGQ